VAKKLFFYALMLLIMTVFIVVVVELSFRIITAAKPKEALPDYTDIFMPVTDSISIGSLKPDYDKQMIGGYGNILRWKNNNYGFRNETDIELKKDSNTIRILVLGDSFTAGYRTDQQNTFCSLLQHNLEATFKNKNIEVLPVWVDNPALGAYYMQLYLDTLKPDLVIYGICLSNDIYQSYYKMSANGGAFNVNADSMIVMRGTRDTDILLNKEKELNATTIDAACLNNNNFSFGMKIKTRIKNYLLSITDVLKSFYFLKNYILAKPGHAIFNTSSYSSPSVFDINNGLGLFLKNQPAVLDTAYHYFYESLKFQNNYCQKVNVPFITVLFGQRFQVQPEDLEATLFEYGLNSNCFDFMLPNHEMKNYFEANGISFYDPTALFIETYKSTHENLYLPAGDMHWNNEGHRLMADYLLPVVVSKVAVQ